MTGKDCRAKGEPAQILIAADDQLVQLSLVGSGSGNGVNRNAAAHTRKKQQSDIGAVDFDPRRELLFWIDTLQRRVFRSALAKGNQSHQGQALETDFAGLGVSPLSLAVDYITGNLYVTTVASPQGVGGNGRLKRMSEPMMVGGGLGGYWG